MECVAPGHGEGEEAEAEGLERPPGQHHVRGVHVAELEQEVVGGKEDCAQEGEAQAEEDLDTVPLGARPQRGLDDDRSVTGAHCAEHTFLVCKWNKYWSILPEDHLPPIETRESRTDLTIFSILTVVLSVHKRTATQKMCTLFWIISRHLLNDSEEEHCVHPY